MKKSTIAIAITSLAMLICGCGHSSSTEDPVHEHIDNNNDHICDVCNERLSECADTDNNHLCDVCGERLSECVDEDHNHRCDICNEGIPYIRSVEIELPSVIQLGCSVVMGVTIDARFDADASYTVEIDNESVVSFDLNTNEITALSLGEAHVTVTPTFDANKSKTVTVEVRNDGFAPDLIEEGFTFTRPFDESILRSFLLLDDQDSLYVPSDDLVYGGVYYKNAYDEDFEIVVGLSTNKDNREILFDIMNGYSNIHCIYDPANAFEFFMDVNLKYSIFIQATSTASGLSYYTLAYARTSDIFTGSNELTVDTDWSSEIKAQFKGYYGNVDIPFFKLGADYIIDSSEGQFFMYDYSANYMISENILASFTKDNGWSFDEVQNAYAKTLDETNVLYATAFFVAEIGNVVMFLVVNEGSSTFPTEVLNEFIGDVTTTSIPTPIGNKFFYSVSEDEEGVLNFFCRVSGGNMANYIALFGDDFNVDIDTYGDATITSIDRTLLIYVYDVSYITNKNGEFAILVYASEAPALVDFPSDIVNAYTSTLTTEVVPGCTGTDFVCEEDEGNNCLMVYVAGSSMSAYLNILRDANFTVTDETYYYVAVSPLKSLRIEIEEGLAAGQFILYIYVSKPLLTSWPATEVANALGEYALEEVPAASGTTYKTSVDEEYPNEIVVTVYGTSTDYNAYIKTLEDAGYTIDSDAYSYVAESSTKTITIYCTDYTDYEKPYFVLDICSHEAPAVEAEFPLAEVQEQIGNVSFPIPTGTSFVTELYSPGDIMVHISGGDRALYIQTLLDAGYTIDDFMSYDNYVCYVEPNKQFAIYIHDLNSNTEYIAEYANYYSYL